MHRRTCRSIKYVVAKKRKSKQTARVVKITSRDKSRTTKDKDALLLDEYVYVCVCGCVCQVMPHDNDTNGQTLRASYFLYLFLQVRLSSQISAHRKRFLKCSPTFVNIFQRARHIRLLSIHTFFSTRFLRESYPTLESEL